MTASPATRPHVHSHPHAPSAGEGAPAGGPAVLDIGGDVGALVLYLDRSWLGTEIHVRPCGERGATTHTGVWERTVNGRDLVVATFPGLAAGSYDILDPTGSPTCSVTVEGGAVVELHL